MLPEVIVTKSTLRTKETDYSALFELQDELESEMRRLMLELKHTKEMYSAAVKEAHFAKQGVHIQDVN